MWLNGDSIELCRKKCSECCGEGTVSHLVPCEMCLGSGNGPRGGRRGCKRCGGAGRIVAEDRISWAARRLGDKTVPVTFLDLTLEQTCVPSTSR